MDTPERNQIGTPVSKVEDSPVFSYICNLSPIKPVKSLHIAQTFHSLNFASLPAVFTSPHINSRKDSRFLDRHQFSDLPKPDFNSEHGNEDKGSTVFLADVNLRDCCSDVEVEKCDSDVFVEEFNVNRNKDCSERYVNLPQAQQHVGSLDYGQLCHDTSLVNLSKEKEKTYSVGTEVHVQSQDQYQYGHARESGEGESCSDWEELISDAAADLMVFDSSNEAETSGGEAAAVFQYLQDSVGRLCNVQPVSLLDQCQQDEHNSMLDCEDIPDGKHILIDHVPDDANFHQNKQDSTDMADGGGKSISLDKKVENQLQHGMRRRCLTFEAAVHEKDAENDIESESFNIMHSVGQRVSDDKMSVTPSPVIGSSSRMLPGIGLHLNSLASTSKDIRIIKHEASRSQLISLPTSVGSLHIQKIGQKFIHKSLSPNSAHGELNLSSNGTQNIQDHQETSLELEELNSYSPKKRRRRENAGEGDACKRCNCKKSKCLKLYCECFAAGVYCVEPCSCRDCFNKPIHEDTVLATRKQIESRNPLAFAPKVIRNSETLPETKEEGNNTPASARHKRGCNCKKSSCLKKYCECYQGGVGCSANCRCEGCKNAFGRKCGFVPLGAEVEEVSEVEKDELNQCQEIIEVGKDELLDNVFPRTPFRNFRQSLKISFFSSGKPPRPSLPTEESLSSCQSSSLSIRKCDNLQPRLAFDKHFQISPDEETPEILREEFSPASGVKITSPNGKRVSPPNRRLGSSLGERSTPTRKLILQSIPSFPPLTPYHNPDGI